MHGERKRLRARYFWSSLAFLAGLVTTFCAAMSAIWFDLPPDVWTIWHIIIIAYIFLGGITMVIGIYLQPRT